MEKLRRENALLKEALRTAMSSQMLSIPDDDFVVNSELSYLDKLRQYWELTGEISPANLLIFEHADYEISNRFMNSVSSWGSMDIMKTLAGIGMTRADTVILQYLLEEDSDAKSIKEILEMGYRETENDLYILFNCYKNDDWREIADMFTLKYTAQEYLGRGHKPVVDKLEYLKDTLTGDELVSELRKDYNEVTPEIAQFLLENGNKLPVSEYVKHYEIYTKVPSYERRFNYPLAVFLIQGGYVKMSDLPEDSKYLHHKEEIQKKL